MALFATACGGVAGPQGWAAPQPAEATIYATISRGKLAALDSQDFSVKWVFPPKEADKSLALEAIYGQPVADSDSVYFGAYDGYVYALRAEDGSQRWRFKTGGPIVGGVALAKLPGGPSSQERDALLAGSEDGRLYVLDPGNGSVIWSFKAGDSIWTRPLVSGSVFAGSVNGRLYALDPSDGRERWSFGADAGLLTDPVLLGADTVLAGGIDETLYAVDTQTGRERWSFEGGSWFWGRPLVPEESAGQAAVFVPNLDGNVYALDENGRKLWEFDTGAPVRSAPLLADGVLIVVSREGQAYGLDPADGQRKWGPTLLEHTVLSDPVPLDGEVLIVAQGGDLMRLDPNTGAQAAIQVEE